MVPWKRRMGGQKSVAKALALWRSQEHRKPNRVGGFTFVRGRRLADLS